jgi:serine/threonine-protein kinase
MEPLGEGGQGAVWKVLDPRDGGVLRALKLVSLVETGPEAFERARREARILASADHPALVACHSLFEDPRAGLVGLVMDLVQGQSLASVASAGHLDQRTTHAVLVQVVDALAYVHHAGLAHRDVKPENVIITDEFWKDPDRPGTVKLVDFGIAATTSNQIKLTATGKVVGTLPYLAPELVDPASWGRSEAPVRDVFALGVMAHVILFGTHPTGLGFGATMIDFARAYKAAQVGIKIPWPPPGLDGPSGGVWAACLALRAANRPRDGVALRGLLTATPVMRTEPMAVPPSPMAKTIAAAPLHGSMRGAAGPRALSPAAAVLIGALAAVAVVGAAFLFLRDRDAIDSGPPIPIIPITPSVPLPAPYPAPVVTVAPEYGACCRDVCNRRLTRFSCPICAGEPPQLPRGQRWWMRVGGVTDHLSANRVCVMVIGSSAPERCFSYGALPDVTGATGRISVSTDDIEEGRVQFALYSGTILRARGPGLRRIGTTRFLTSALCMGLSLHMAVPGQDDVPVSVYLDDR